MRWGGGSGSGRGGEGSATFLATAGASRQEDSADASSLASIMWTRACRWRVGPERPRRASARARPLRDTGKCLARQRSQSSQLGNTYTQKGSMGRRHKSPKVKTYT